MANEVTGAVPWQAMVAGQVTFLPTLSLGASEEPQKPRPPGRDPEDALEANAEIPQYTHPR